MKAEINYAYTCHIGKRRFNNEDNFWCCGKRMDYKNKDQIEIECGTFPLSENPTVAVFDGMGGENCGEIAADIAAKSFGDYYQENKNILLKDTNKFINDSCKYMNEHICNYGRSHQIMSMGTTAAIAIFGVDGVFLGNLGDSRIYYLENKHLTQVSTDHIMKNYFYQKPPLTQYLGTFEEETLLEPDVKFLKYKKAAKYLLCSDGLTDMVSDKEIEEILAEEKEVSEITRTLLNRALDYGGKDNITIVVCEIKTGFEKNIINNLIRKYNRWKEGKIVEK